MGRTLAITMPSMMKYMVLFLAICSLVSCKLGDNAAIREDRKESEARAAEKLAQFKKGKNSSAPAPAAPPPASPPPPTLAKTDSPNGSETAHEEANISIEDSYESDTNFKCTFEGECPESNMCTLVPLIENPNTTEKANDTIVSFSLPVYEGPEIPLGFYPQPNPTPVNNKTRSRKSKINAQAKKIIGNITPEKNLNDSPGNTSPSEVNANKTETITEPVFPYIYHSFKIILLVVFVGVVVWFWFQGTSKTGTNTRTKTRQQQLEDAYVEPDSHSGLSKYDREVRKKLAIAGVLAMERAMQKC